MAFLGKIGKSLGIGDLTHKPFKALEAIIPTIGGALLAGPGGAALGAGIGNAIGQKIQGRSILGSLEGGAETFGLAAGGEALAGYGASALGLGGNAAAAGDALGTTGPIGSFPSSTVGAPVASAGGSAGALASDPGLISGLASETGGDAAGGLGSFAGGGVTVPGVAGIDAADAAGGTGVGGVGAGGLSAAAGTLPASTATGGSGGILGTLGNAADKAGTFLQSPAGRVATVGAQLGQSVLAGSRTDSAEKALKGQAGALDAQGRQLQASLQSGQLPPGMQGYFDSALQDAQTSIRSKYANLGLSGSTMEAQELQAASTQVDSLKSQQIMSLLQQGTSDITSSSGIYKEILANNLQQDKDLSSAISGAVGAFAGSQAKPATGTTA